MTKWTPKELRAIAGAHATEIWIGTVRSALRHAADLTDAAHAVRDENERLRNDLADAYEKAAQACERTMMTGWAGDRSDMSCDDFNKGCEECAAAIRALAQTGANDADR